VRVIPIKLFKLFGVLCGLQYFVVHLDCFFHELAHSVYRIIVEGRVVIRSRLGYGLHVKHVLGALLVTFVYKEHTVELFDLDVPGIGGTSRAHDGCRSFICHEDICLTSLCKLLNVFIVNDRGVFFVALKRRNLPGFQNTRTVPQRIELVKSSSFNLDAFITWSHLG